MQPSDLIVRTFRWADLPRRVQLLNEAHAADRSGQSTTLELERESLGQPNLRPQEDFWVAELQGQLVGMADLVRELGIGRVVSDGVVHPHYRRRGIGQALLHRVLSHAFDLGTSAVYIAARSGAEGSRAFLEAQGFLITFKQLEMRLEKLGRIVPEPPSGFRYRTFLPGDEAAFAALQNAAFGGSWGFNPNTSEEIAYRVRMTGCRPEGVRFLVQGEELVAYCWTRMQEADGKKQGLIWMIGTHPSYRGFGLGRAILAAGIAYLQEAGAAEVELTVNGDNTTAIQLYHSVGFLTHNEIWWYEKRLRT